MVGSYYVLAIGMSEVNRHAHSNRAIRRHYAKSKLEKKGGDLGSLMLPRDL